MSKKVSTLLLSILMVCICLSGCSGSAAKKPASVSGTTTQGAAQTTAGSSAPKEKLNPPGEYPIVNEPVTLSIYTASTDIGDQFEYDLNPFTKWATDKTGISFTFTVVNAADAQEKLRLMMTAGDYPDILFRSGFSLSEQQLYGSQGLLRPLNKLIDTYCKNIPKMFEEYPVAKEMYTLNDGNMYDIPSVNECYHCAVTQKMWVYQPWLDALKLKLPTTTEEFYDMLVQFKDKDPNGNGKKDEIALACSPKGWDTSLEGFLMQPFSKTDVYVDKGKVKVGYNSDGWREGLRYLHKLYAEGLVAPESLTQDDVQLSQLGSVPGDHILGAAPGGYQGCYTTLSEETDWQKWVTIPALKGPSGRRECKYDNVQNFYSSFSITKKCKNPEAAIRFADFLVEPETSLRNTLGVLGEDWEWISDASQLGINGKPALYKQNVALAAKNRSWNQIGLTCRTSDLRLGTLATKESEMEVILYAESKNNYYPYVPADDEILPMLIYNEADAAELAMYEAAVKEYVQEMTARFITGESIIDKDWANYLSELDNAGLQRMLTIYQKAYDSKYSK